MGEIVPKTVNEISRPQRKAQESVVMSLRLSNDWAKLWQQLTEQLDHPAPADMLRDGILLLAAAAYEKDDDGQPIVDVVVKAKLKNGKEKDVTPRLRTVKRKMQ